MTKEVSLEAARAAKESASKICSSLVGDEFAIGITRLADNHFGLKVNLPNEPDSEIQFPEEVDGVPLQVEVVGKIRKLALASSKSESSAVIVLFDWFHEQTLREDPSLARRSSEFRKEVQRRHPEARTYEFLPLIAIEAGDEECKELANHDLIQAVIRPKYGIDNYGILLDALSALRSQTGHQMYQFYEHVSKASGGKLPHEAWEGGRWPASPPYPRIVDSSGRIEFDDSISVAVPPAIMPVINMSFGPSDNLDYVGVGDAIVLAQTAVSATHLLVVAAGNQSDVPPHSWLRSNAVLSVGATEDVEGKKLAEFSARGIARQFDSGVDVVAFGSSPFGNEVSGPGTSFAAARVSSLAILCQAVIAQLHRAWLVACGYPEFGVPLVGIGIIDLNRDCYRPRVDIPGLPFAGLNFDVVDKAFRLIRERGADMRFSINPAALRTAILEAAQPMPNYEQHEVGSGFVSLDGLIKWLSGLSLADAVRRWTMQDLSTDTIAPLANLRPFDEEGIRALAQVVFRARPTWVYDLEAPKGQRFTADLAVSPDEYENISKNAREIALSAIGHASAVIWTDA